MVADVEVHIVMPVHGRKEKSVEAMKRLKATAGHPNAHFVAVAGYQDTDTLTAMASDCTAMVSNQMEVLSYWSALSLATANLPDEAYVINVANDIIPAIHWLTRAVNYVKSSPRTVFGFNGDGYDSIHACHFMIQMRQVRSYGGWPVWYHHNFGDTEFVTRAIEEGIFHKDPWAILFHDHPIISGSAMDDVYLMGNRHFVEDMKLYEKRRGNRWKH